MLQILTYKNYALQNFALHAQNVNDMLHHFFNVGESSNIIRIGGKLKFCI